MKLHRQKLRSWIVYDKYFKQTSPNFLTWAEKEHIRHLHEQDPDEWTPERLSESFPADVYVIKKLIKNSWAPRSIERVKKHDEAVKKNWNSFNNGEIEGLKPELMEHLKKFAHREVDTSALPKFEPRKPAQGWQTKNNEFMNMITSCKKYEATSIVGEERQIEMKPKDPEEQDEHLNRMLIDPPKDKRMRRRMTLDELQRILDKPDEYDEPKNPGGTEVVTFPTSDEIISMDKFKTEGNVAKLKDQDLMKMYNEPVTELIRIPRKVWKRGATYKVGDCFYDDDGEFLYRVPGMTKVG